MTSSNHMLIGVAIAAVTKNPLIALPAAFVSHFVFDAVPHFGFPKENGFAATLKHTVTYAIIAFDIISWPVALLLAYKFGWVAVFAGLLAASPDLIWVYRYFRYERQKRTPPEHWWIRFHQWIQWGEKPWGIVIEISWFTLLSILLFEESV